MHTRKYLIAASTLAVMLTLSSQSFAGNQHDFSTSKNSNSPLLTYSSSNSSYADRDKQGDTTQYSRTEAAQENAAYGSRFQRERCEVLKNNSKALQRAGCM